jgi:hypothetical protein
MRPLTKPLGLCVALILCHSLHLGKEIVVLAYAHHYAKQSHSPC